MGSGVEQWRGLVSSYGWDVEIALCLMSYESGGNPNAQNRSSGASGLMQVLPSWADNFGYTPADLFIPEVNLSISYALYLDGGWNHWSPWKRGACH
jgi:soluble lytic murein transglycosylase-like protein